MDKHPVSRRDGTIDLAKALAICAVVFIHCSAGHFARYEALRRVPVVNRWLI